MQIANKMGFQQTKKKLLLEPVTKVIHNVTNVLITDPLSLGLFPINIFLLEDGRTTETCRFLLFIIHFIALTLIAIHFWLIFFYTEKYFPSSALNMIFYSVEFP
jgi:hypothetical protein